jgi:predicted ATPase
VKLERFKAAFEPPPVQLLPFNVLIGRNNSGKSTFFEALQWLDTAIRRDVREASDRYYGVHDLISRRDKPAVPYFALELGWESRNPADKPLRYRIQIKEMASGVPAIVSETLYQEGHADEPLVWTARDGARFIGEPRDEPRQGSGAETSSSIIPLDRSDELALRFARYALRDMGLVDEFWSRAVFLRLSPRRLADSSTSTRRSFDPMLDEEGETLPALINELSAEQLKHLVSELQKILPGVEGIMVSPSEFGRDIRVHYSLHERIQLPSGDSTYPSPVPSWMLSEGARRLTAILALLIRKPAPSLLCIEEIENSLDPWSVRALLQHLQAAAERGTQIIVTTHSPWVLDAVPMGSILQASRVPGDVHYERFAARPEIQAFDDAVPAGMRYIQEGNANR